MRFIFQSEASLIADIKLANSHLNTKPSHEKALPGQLAIIGEGIQELPCGRGGKPSAAIMSDSVGDGQVGYAKWFVVACYLVEYVLGDLNVRAFAFDDHKGLATLAVNDGVGPFFQTEVLQGGFNGDKALRIGFLGDKPMQEMLPDPLFRGEGYEAPAEVVEYHLLAALFADGQISRWKIECLHRLQK